MGVQRQISRSQVEMKIALLVTDDDAEFGGEKGIADSIIRRFKEVNENLQIHAIYVVNGVFPREDEHYDGFIISGSHFSVNDNFEWKRKLEDFIRNTYFDSSAPKLVGICFGHQLIAKALGGKVGPNPSGKFIWGCDCVEASQELMEKVYYKESLSDAKQFHIMQSHYEQILEVSDHGKTVASTPECTHEVVTYGDNIISFQGHPEVTAQKMVNISLPVLKKNGKITDEQERLARNSLEKDNGYELVNLILNFFKS